MSVASRPAMPVMPVRQPTFRARRERLVSRLATYITVLTAVIAGPASFAYAASASGSAPASSAG